MENATSGGSSGAATKVIPPIITELMYQNSCVAYVGAGFSAACGMPGWKGLLKNLIEYGAQWVPAESLTHASDAVESGDYPLAASLLRTIMSPAQINDCLNNTFGTAAFHQDAAKQEHMRGRMGALVRAGWAGIVTTNYDRLIEQALWQLTEGGNWMPYLQIDGEPTRLCEVLATARELRPFFVKLHGSITGARIVLSTEEYDETYLRSPQVSTFLQSLMLQYHVVFIGCSLEDEVVRIRRKLTADFKGLIPTAYAVMPRNPRNEARFHSLKTSASIEPIWYDVADDDHRGMDEILQYFSTLPKQPEDVRALIRFRKLADRFARVSRRNKDLMSYIAGLEGRSVGSQVLVQDMGDNEELRKRFAPGTMEDELKYRLLFLMAIGLLWEEVTPDGPQYRIPPSLNDEDLRKHGVSTPNLNQDSEAGQLAPTSP